MNNVIQRNRSDKQSTVLQHIGQFKQQFQHKCEELLDKRYTERKKPRKAIAHDKSYQTIISKHNSINPNQLIELMTTIQAMLDIATTPETI